MVDLGELLPITCPNGAACPHNIEQHRYEPARQRWVCTIEDCADNPWPVDEQPHAEVQRVGRWTYRVSVDHGLLTYGPDGYGWHVLGRRRAERKAARVLARYVRDQAREAEVIVIEPREAK